MWCLLCVYACVCELHNFIVSIKLLTQTLIVWLEEECTENLIWLLKQDFRVHWGEPWNSPKGRWERRFTVSNSVIVSSLSNLTTFLSNFVYISSIFFSQLSQLLKLFILCFMLFMSLATESNIRQLYAISYLLYFFPSLAFPLLCRHRPCSCRRST